MKFKTYLSLIADPAGFIPTPQFQWVIRKNDRSTAREEAIAAEILKQANPRENITGRFPWGAEEQMVLQQLWMHPSNEFIKGEAEWRDVPVRGAKDLYTVEHPRLGKAFPVPNAVKEPGTVRGDFTQRIREALGE